MSLSLDDSIENCHNTINKLFKIQKQIIHCRQNNIENYKYKHYESVTIQNIMNENEKILSELYPPPQISGNVIQNIMNENEKILSELYPPQISGNVIHKHTSLDPPQIVTSEDPQDTIVLVSGLYDLLNYMKENNIETFHYDKFDTDELQVIIDHNNDLIF
jgi:hypothetical protein